MSAPRGRPGVVRGAGRAIAFVAALASCTRSRTELVVTVTSELAWGEGAGVQSVVVEIRRGGPTGPGRDRRVTPVGRGADRSAPPLHVGVVPDESSDDVDTPVWVEALGCAGSYGCTRDDSVAAQHAQVRFGRGRTLELLMPLSAACAGARCTTLQRCVVATGACRPAVEANSTMLREYVPAPDAQAAEDDAPPGNGNVPAGGPRLPLSDGGSDAGSCGEATQRCCPGTSACGSGLACHEGACCALASAACTTAADCCDGASCGATDHRCCRIAGGRCGSTAECCEGTRCGTDMVCH